MSRATLLRYYSSSGGVTSSVIPPVSPVPGERWVSVPEGGVAGFDGVSWRPASSVPGSGEAAEAANAFLGIDGLWVAEDGD